MDQESRKIDFFIISKPTSSCDEIEKNTKQRKLNDFPFFYESNCNVAMYKHFCNNFSNFYQKIENTFKKTKVAEFYFN